MTKKRAGMSQKAGLPPGSLVFVGEKHSDEVGIEIISYNQSEVVDRRVDEFDSLIKEFHNDRVNWINIEGLHDIELIQKIGNRFGVNVLLLEDLVNTHKRPFSEDFETYLAVSLKSLHGVDGDAITYEQITFVMGHNFVLAFQERPGDIFDPIRSRLRQPNNRLTKRGADYLLYRLMDTVVDGYFIVLEKIGDKIEALEELVFESPTQDTLKQVQLLKTELIYLRKSMFPLREALGKLIKETPEIIDRNTLGFLADVYEHTIHAIETVEIYRDLTSGLVDMYMNNVSNRMNEVMKVLTIIATIFIPLTFIAGIYGMNFQFMPELGWKWGYFSVWLVMLFLGTVMVIYFKRRNWW